MKMVPIRRTTRLLPPAFWESDLALGKCQRFIAPISNLEFLSARIAGRQPFS